MCPSQCDEDCQDESIKLKESICGDFRLEDASRLDYFHNTDGVKNENTAL